jgi:tetratricopeptide (TPR) repeat protein
MTDPQQCLGEAIVTLRENQPDTARDLAQRAVELGLDDTTVWGVIALANRDLADYENAQLAADRAIARDPRNARAYIVKADAFYTQSNMKAAAAFYRQALIINPLHPDMVQEIRVEFLRAQTRVQELQQAFADHMTREVQPLLEEAESTPRMQAAVDLLLGKRKQYYPQPRHIMYPGLPYP